MTENKTKETEKSVEDFINAVEDQKKRQDSFELLKLFQEVSGFEPKMWGDSIIGFGSYHYKYASGREGDFLLIGFSPRKNAISLYLSCDIEGQHASILSKLGKFKNGKSCLYVNKLEDINIEVLIDLVKASMDFTLKKYPNQS
ncbi:DUF1801 domain-containing protein [Aquiflexum lacus]|uniref:DUF1801 domain-containing protein n=1 Tax=Aquiflexum lacus TaxID=2483805 RepID=UPI0018931CE4|nr:DUF1801 domain-containing protein [Aquiflexum lacus]